MSFPVGFSSRRSYRPGAIDTGDQVFVDKCSYNFVKPHNGDVLSSGQIIFRRLRPDPVAGPPFYIKRWPVCLATSAHRFAISLHQRQKGRGLRLRTGHVGATAIPRLCAGHEYLSKPDQTYTVPRNGYFAMGDNSYNSFDSRYWDRFRWRIWSAAGYYVYWPFYPHGDLFVRPVME